ncbi:hypothetical protein DY000_02035181 [Brassica cretica]|uniref:Uncharacterized protein n=1 Tax=Brassica cretica TaxID=69181 RepID=A0ABQ7DRZ9_BRACR|nr:hypothetical protein DY000_02035181 [Brassica cretica]
MTDFRTMLVNQSVKAPRWILAFRSKAGGQTGKFNGHLHKLKYSLFNVGPFAFEPVCPNEMVLFNNS